jgi:hypothetical protein
MAADVFMFSVLNSPVRYSMHSVEAFDHPHVVSDHHDGRVLLAAELAQ